MDPLDWIKRGKNGRDTSRHYSPEKKVFLDHGERAALKRLVQLYDDGLIGTPQAKIPGWEKDLDATARRLGFRDRFGHRVVQLSDKEAHAVRAFGQDCQQDAAAFGDHSQIRTDIDVVSEALQRNAPRQSPHLDEGLARERKREQGKSHDIPF